METTVERLESTRVQLTLQFSAEEMKAAFGRAYNELARHIEVRGFRKGKAPRKILERIIDASALQQQVAGDLIPDALAASIEESKLHVIGEPDISFEGPTPNDAFSVKAVLTVLPDIEVGSIDGLNIVEPAVRISEEDVDSVIDALRQRMSRSVEVTDRPIQEGDFVCLSYQITCDDEQLYDPESLPQMYLEVGSEWYEPVIDKHLVGLSVGESKQIDVEYPEDYDNPRLAGRPARFDVTIDSISTRQVPEIDEEFLKLVGADSAEDLRARVRSERESELAEAVRGVVEDQLIGTLLARVSFEVPDKLIEAHAKDLRETWQAQLDEEGTSLQDFLNNARLTEEGFARQLREEAERGLRRSLLISAVAKENGIEVTEEDVEESVWTLAQAAKMTFTEMLETVKASGQLETMLRREERRRVLDLLREKAHIVKREMTFEELRSGEWARGLPGLEHLCEAEGKPEDDSPASGGPGNDATPEVATVRPEEGAEAGPEEQDTVEAPAAPPPDEASVDEASPDTDPSQ